MNTDWHKLFRSFIRVYLCLSVVGILVSQSSAQESYRSWTTYGGDPAGTKYSALTQINRTNVTRLKPAWIYRCDDMRLKPASTIECNPIIIDGTMYITTAGLKLVALDAANGKERWVFDPWSGQGGRGVNRGVTYWSNRIFFVAGNF